MKNLIKNTENNREENNNEIETFDIDNFYGYADDISYESHHQFINDVQDEWLEMRDYL